MQINGRWLQFGYINTKGNLTRVPFRMPFHTDLSIDQDFPFNILGKDYVFTCVRDETVSNNSDTVDKVFVVITNNQ